MAFTATLVPVVGFYDVLRPRRRVLLHGGLRDADGIGAVEGPREHEGAEPREQPGLPQSLYSGGTSSGPSGLVMGAASLTGAQIGSRLAIRMGTRLIRLLIVIVCCAVAIRLLMDSENSLRAFIVRFVSNA